MKVDSSGEKGGGSTISVTIGANCGGWRAGGAAHSEQKGLSSAGPSTYKSLPAKEC